MFLTLLSQATTLVMVSACLWALVRGKWPERVVAVAYAVNWMGSAVGEDRRPHHHGQPVILALDILFLILLLGLTASCRRGWLLWMSACSLLVVLTHITALMDVGFGQWSYQTAYYVWSLGALLAFGIGVAVEGGRPVVALIRLPGRSARSA